jgi:hypothetical protein
MYMTPPWTPTAISLTFAPEGYWWQTDERDHRPQRWAISADVRHPADCPDEIRHVGRVELAVAELTEEPTLLDVIDTGKWALDFLDQTVIDRTTGTFVTDLEYLVAPGPSRIIIVRGLALNDAWRGVGLSAPLLAAALHTFAPIARLAACRLHAQDIRDLVPDLTPEEASSLSRYTMEEASNVHA